MADNMALAELDKLTNSALVISQGYSELGVAILDGLGGNYQVSDRLRTGLATCFAAELMRRIALIKYKGWSTDKLFANWNQVVAGTSLPTLSIGQVYPSGENDDLYIGSELTTFLLDKSRVPHDVRGSETPYGSVLKDSSVLKRFLPPAYQGIRRVEKGVDLRFMSEMIGVSRDMDREIGHLAASASKLRWLEGAADYMVALEGINIR